MGGLSASDCTRLETWPARLLRRGALLLRRDLDRHDVRRLATVVQLGLLVREPLTLEVPVSFKYNGIESVKHDVAVPG